MTEGKLIWLNGPSSSGKTSLGTVIREDPDDPYLFTGFDHFALILPRRYWGHEDGIKFDWTPTGEPDSITMGKTASRFVTGMCHAVATLITEGHNVIVETGFTAEELRLCCPTLAPFAPLFVGVECPLGVLEQREASRGDRVRGLARLQYHTLPPPDAYDLTVDTSLMTPEAGATMIREFRIHGVCSAVRRLADRELIR